MVAVIGNGVEGGLASNSVNFLSLPNRNSMRSGHAHRTTGCTCLARYRYN